MSSIAPLAQPGDSAADSADSAVVALVEGMLDLVPLPAAYIRIRELVADPDTSFRDVAEVVNSDPALTGRVLRLANSAYLALATKVDSIEHGVRVLGMSQIHDMALATSAVGSLSKLRAEVFDIYQFWKLSIYTAVSARRLADHCLLPSPQRLFISGLMHDIGSLIMAHELPEGFTECRDKARKADRPYFEFQRELFGFDYADVGAELMRQWSLPEPLWRPVSQHTRAISNLDVPDQAPAAVVQVAATTARAAVWEGPDSEPVPEYDGDAIQHTGMDAEAIEQMMSEADAEIAEAISILLPQGG